MELKESLEICIKMWDWLADHPGSDKDDAVEALKLPWMMNECACCAYADGCYKGWPCPLFGLWSKNKDDLSCNDEQSLYTKWRKAKTPATTTKYARQIADMARLRLKDFTY